MDRSYSTVSSNGNNGLFKLYNPGVLRHFFPSRKISSFFEVLHLEFVWIFLILDHSLWLFWPVLASSSFFNRTKILLQGLFLWLRLLVKSHAYYNAGMCWFVFHLQDFQIHQIAQRSFREVINVVSCKIPSNLRTISKASHWGYKWLWEAANLICIEETYKDFSHNSLLMIHHFSVLRILSHLWICKKNCRMTWLHRRLIYLLFHILENLNGNGNSGKT